MAEEDSDSYTIEFKLSKDFVSAYADGATVSGPVGAKENYVINFYMDVHGLKDLTLNKIDDDGRYEIVPDERAVVPYREGQVRVVMSRDDMAGLASSIQAHLAEE